jgi:hypothetical protein
MDGPRIEFRRGQEILFSKTAQANYGTHQTSNSVATGVLPLGIKRPGSEVYHLLRSSTEVKNERDYTATHCVFLWFGHE